MFIRYLLDRSIRRSFRYAAEREVSYNCTFTNLGRVRLVQFSVSVTHLPLFGSRWKCTRSHFGRLLLRIFKSRRSATPFGFNRTDEAVIPVLRASVSPYVSAAVRTPGVKNGGSRTKLRGPSNECWVRGQATKSVTNCRSLILVEIVALAQEQTPRSQRPI